MSHVGAVRVSVLVHQPFPLAGVSVARSDVLGLEMLQLTVDVVSVSHSHFRQEFLDLRFVVTIYLLYTQTT